MKKLKISLKEEKDWRGQLISQMIVDGLNIKFFLVGAESSYLISAYIDNQNTKIGDINIMYRRSLSINGVKAFSVKWIGVSEQYRGKKIASKLYALAIEQAKKYGGTRFFSDERLSPDSKRIWLGWKVKGIPVKEMPVKSGKIKNAVRYFIDIGG